MSLTVFCLPVEVGVVGDGDLPGAGVQLEALNHGLVPGDPGVDNAAAIPVMRSHLEIKIKKHENSPFHLITDGMNNLGEDNLSSLTLTVTSIGKLVR